MREIRPGFWIPDNREGGKWLFKYSPEGSSLPTYALNEIKTSIDACRLRRTVIDGGAHVGCWTVYLQRRFQRVLAFEPAPDNYECLVKNVDPNVTTYNAALTSANTEVRLNYGDVGKSVSWRVVDKADGPTIPVKGYAIDSFELTDLDLLKLDIEGHEYDALQGAIKTLERCRPVVIIEESVAKTGRASEFLVKLGMKCICSWKNDRLFVWR